MFNPEMMRMAQDMMSKMSPEQIAQMQQAAANMTPDQIRQAQAMAAHMTPDQLRQAQSMASNLTPEQMAQASAAGGGGMGGGFPAAAASSHMSAQQKYMYDASVMLKTEGNRLHGQRQYGEAAEKYRKAISNLDGLATPEAAELRMACQNNLSNCHLQLGQWDKCVDLCSAVLRADGSNRKALYRRGQAYSGQGRHEEAVRDLRRALELSPDNERAVVAEKLEEAQQRQAQATRGVVIEEVTEEAEPQRPEGAEQQQPQQEEGLVDTGDGTSEDIPGLEPATQAAVPAAAAAAASAAASSQRASVPGVPPGMDPERLRQMQQMMQSNPQMLQTSAAMMAAMSDEQLAAMVGQSGMPGMTPEMARMAASMLKGMPPEQLASMADQAAETMRAGGPLPSMPEGVPAPAAEAVAAAAAAVPASGGMPAPAAPAEVVEQLKQNPDMMKGVAQMLESMPPEQLEAMAAAMPGAPAGMKMDAEQMRMAAQMMKNMTPADLERMSKLAEQMGGVPGMPPAVTAPAAAADSSGAAAAAAAGAAGAPPAGFDPGAMPGMDMSQMRRMMEDPQMLKTMQNMLRGMDSEALANMFSSGGLKMTPEQAKQMVDKLGSVSETHLEILSKLMRWYNMAVAAYQRLRAWAASNGALVVALVVLALALLLRWLGWM